jgi:hypothetical protein
MMISSALRSGAVATVGTTAALLALGGRHARTPWAPLDAASHIVWGDRALAVDKLDVKHTLVGAVLHTGAILLWSGVQEAVFVGTRTWPRALAVGAAMSALAYVVDYKVVPKRLTPGFEWKLPRRALVTAYGALALSLAVGALVARR